MLNTKYALFYDFHTDFNNPDVGKDFDAEKLTDEIKACGVDFLTWHARCNQGGAYYNTEIGLKHPALKSDLIGELADACKRKGITLSVYFNGDLSDQELIEHPEWGIVPLKGEPLRFNEPFFRRACYNSPFRDHLKAMTVEVLEKYHLDGLFIDCLLPVPCTCKRCTAEMLSRGLDPKNRENVLNFSQFSATRLAEEIKEAALKVNPDVLYFLNGRPFEEVAHLETQLEFECLPTNPEWGYECLPQAAHYLRTISQGKPVLNMTGRFYDWGDFGGLRPAPALEYDLFYGAANGMRPEIGGHFHPRGDMDQPVFDRIKEVYSLLQQYDPWVIEAVNKPEIAVVYPRRGQYRPTSNSLSAAVRMLTELKYQINVITEFSDWSDYKLLIFPDDVPFTPEIVKRVKIHLEKGGKIFATGNSGLLPDKYQFALKNWPAVYDVPCSMNPLYYMPDSRLAKGLPKMPLSIYQSGGAECTAADGAETLMQLVEPYFNYGWDGLRTHFYEAPKGISKLPFLLKKGSIIYCTAKLFEGYYNQAPDTHRKLLENILQELHPQPKLRTCGMPCFSRAFVQKKGNMETVHLLAYAPENKGGSIALDDRSAVLHAQIELRTDGRKIHTVYQAPQKTPLEFTENSGYAKVKVPVFEGYTLIVFEYE